MKNRQRGFTLVELLVVIAIIGLLSTIGVVSLNQARAKARDAKRLSDVRQLSSILELYYNGAQQYPQSLAGTGTTPGIVMSNSARQSGAICESGVIEAAATTPSCAAGVVELLRPLPFPPAGTGPAGANVSEYRYVGYASTTPSVADCNATGTDGSCQGYGIQFGLETSISGVAAGLNCFTASGPLTGQCVSPTAD